MRTRRPPILSLLLLVLPAVPVPLLARSTGETSGFVRDTTAATLPGATAAVRFPELNLTRDTTANASGFYVLNSLPNEFGTSLRADAQQVNGCASTSRASPSTAPRTWTRAPTPPRPTRSRSTPSRSSR